MADKKDLKEAEGIIDRSARSIARYLRISPRKMRGIINTVRHKPVNRALEILMGFNKKAARMVEKHLKSAIANAKVLEMEEKRLYISKIYADGGPSLKRFMSRSMGRADRILKRTTHLTIELKENKQVKTDHVEPGSKQKKEKKPKGAKVAGSASKKTASAAAS